MISWSIYFIEGISLLAVSFFIDRIIYDCFQYFFFFFHRGNMNAGSIFFIELIWIFRVYFPSKGSPWWPGNNTSAMSAGDKRSPPGRVVPVTSNMTLWWLPWRCRVYWDWLDRCQYSVTLVRWPSWICSFCLRVAARLMCLSRFFPRIMLFPVAWTFKLPRHIHRGDTLCLVGFVFVFVFVFFLCILFWFWFLVGFSFFFFFFWGGGVVFGLLLLLLFSSVLFRSFFLLFLFSFFFSLSLLACFLSCWLIDLLIWCMCLGVGEGIGVCFYVCLFYILLSEQKGELPEHFAVQMYGSVCLHVQFSINMRWRNTLKQYRVCKVRVAGRNCVN